jgi:GT2 family glycosyltransferase
MRGNVLELIRVEIVIPVFNRRATTLQCLKSLSRINRKNLDIHIIVVDDASTDGTKHAIETCFPEVEVVLGSGDLWYSGGINLGIQTALKYNPKYILTINDDEVFDSEFLKLLVETAEKYPRSVVGSLLLLWDTPHKVFQTAAIWDFWKGGWFHWQNQTVWTMPKSAFEVEIIVGNCVLYPTDAIKECGLMDLKHHPHFGDAEYTPRMRKNGWKLLIEPQSRVFCQPNDVPKSPRSLDFLKLFDAIFVDLRHIHNLRRRYFCTIAGATTKLQGKLAVLIFFARLIIGKNTEKERFGELEPPLSETFANKLVNIDVKAEH